jgi:hypothetical protein
MAARLAEVMVSERSVVPLRVLQDRETAEGNARMTRSMAGGAAPGRG